MSTRSTTNPARPALARVAPAFTLMEMLVVMGIIVLILGVALPAFNLISGTRSLDAAVNQASALLGQARNRAIGIQQRCGVAFWTDPTTGRTQMAVVDMDPETQLYIDLMPGYEIEALPTGVAAQGIHNCAVVNGARTSDGYIRQPALVLFDGCGQLVSRNYAVRQSGQLGVRMQLGGDLNVSALYSQFGLAFFEREAHDAQGFGNRDPLLVGGPYDSGGPTSELAEEVWLDSNALPVVVSRYNGTLIRAE